MMLGEFIIELWKKLKEQQPVKVAAFFQWLGYR